MLPNVQAFIWSRFQANKTWRNWNCYVRHEKKDGVIVEELESINAIANSNRARLLPYIHFTFTCVFYVSNNKILFKNYLWPLCDQFIGEAANLEELRRQAENELCMFSKNACISVFEQVGYYWYTWPRSIHHLRIWFDINVYEQWRIER